MLSDYLDVKSVMYGNALKLQCHHGNVGFCNRSDPLICIYLSVYMLFIFLFSFIYFFFFILCFLVGVLSDYLGVKSVMNGNALKLKCHHSNVGFCNSKGVLSLSQMIYTNSLNHDGRN